MEAFKEAFSEENSLRIGREVHRVWPEFPLDRFGNGLGMELAPLALKARVGVVADRLATVLPQHPGEMFPILVAALASEDGSHGLQGFSVWPLTELVARHGLLHPKLAFAALREMTIRFTAEFALRPFLRHDCSGTLAQLKRWLDDPNPHVRRLVSEGSRPLLPWGMRLPELLEPPHPTLGLLERLHRDDSAYVRLSVANHLNDFSKFHPELVLGLLRQWLEQTRDDSIQRKLARHACRTLVKSGHRGALELLGAAAAGSVELLEFQIQSGQVAMGERLEFRLRLANRTLSPQQVVLDYRLHFLRANGRNKPKVFKWRVLELAAEEAIEIHGQHVFREVTTRRHYLGTHQIQPQVNGETGPLREFLLR
jgi:3-methyladenine DNA glycosylase AlkC